jgi:hypothetical protein
MIPNMPKLLVVLALALTLGACSQSGPSATAKAFTNHLAAGEISQAVPYLATEIRALLGDQKLTMALREAVKDNGSTKVTSFKTVSEEINGEWAKGTYAVRFEGVSEPEEIEYEFVREQKEWKIFIDPSSGK